MAWWHDFHFLRPWWLLGLLLAPVAYALAARGGRERRELARLIDAELMPHVLHGTNARGRAWPPALLAIGAALCALALAGPAWDRVASPLYASRAAQVVAVSLSRHMLARDVAPSRIDRARYKARDLLAANGTGLNGLVAYAGEAFAVAPLTTDAGSLNDLLDALSPDTMPTDGNDAAQAIERGAALIRDAKASGGDLILLTDDADAAAQSAARKARSEGVRVSVLGIGTPQGSPVPDGEGGLLRDSRGDVVVARRNDDALRALAEAGGGRYVPIADDDRDVAALKPGDRPGQSLVQADGQSADEWQDRGPWLLLPLLAVFALAFRRGWLLLVPLAVLPCLPSTAQAGTWSDLWRRPDQQAAAALRQGDAKRAQALAHDPALRGAAAYHAGDYAAAADAWRGVPGADAAYNLGNALAKQGQYTEAIAAYDRALKENPAHADAKANRQAVEDWLRQQPPPQDKKPQDKQDKHGSGKGGDGTKGQPGKDDKQQGDQKDDKNKSGEDAKNGDQGDRADARPDAGSKGEQNGQGPEKQGQGEAKPPSAQEQAEQKAQAEQARQALQRQMDQALREGKTGAGEAPHELGAVAADDPQAKLPADVRRALQRVPDDPGALLRRKFELEYRQRHGDAGEGD